MNLFYNLVFTFGAILVISVIASIICFFIKKNKLKKKVLFLKKLLDKMVDSPNTSKSKPRDKTNLPPKPPKSRLLPTEINVTRRTGDSNPLRNYFKQMREIVENFDVTDTIENRLKSAKQEYEDFNNPFYLVKSFLASPFRLSTKLFAGASKAVKYTMAGITWLIASVVIPLFGTEIHKWITSLFH